MRTLEASGVRLHVGAELLVFESDSDLGIASTAVFGGGLRRGRCIVSMKVPSGYDGCDPAGEIRALANSLGWRADVGLMTAVALEQVRLAAASVDGVTAVAAVTAGVARPWAAGSSSGPHPPAGTINTVVLLDRRVTAAAALNLVATVTEAKVLALVEAEIRTQRGELASGTATDAVVIAWPDSGPALRYGGPATAIGWAAAAATRQALREALGG